MTNVGELDGHGETLVRIEPLVLTLFSSTSSYSSSSSSSLLLLSSMLIIRRRENSRVDIIRQARNSEA